MKKPVSYFRTADGKCPIEDFLNGLPAKAAQKVVWVLSLLENLEFVPSTYFAKLPGTKEIWECRIGFASNAYRILCFLSGESSVVLTHGFAKKRDKTSRSEIEKAETYRKDFMEREGLRGRP